MALVDYWTRLNICTTNQQ